MGDLLIFKDLKDPQVKQEQGERICTYIGTFLFITGDLPANKARLTRANANK
jgi:hypothetical protein